MKTILIYMTKRCTDKALADYQSADNLTYNPRLTIGRYQVIQKLILLSYLSYLFRLRLLSRTLTYLKDCRVQTTKMHPDALLHYLLPEQRDNDTIRSLRNSQPFPLIRARTNKFCKSFLPYCLKNFT